MAHMYSGLGSFAKYVPGDVVRLLLKGREEAVLGAARQNISVCVHVHAPPCPPVSRSG